MFFFLKKNKNSIFNIKFSIVLFNMIIKHLITLTFKLYTSIYNINILFIKINIYYIYMYNTYFELYSNYI